MLAAHFGYRQLHDRTAACGGIGIARESTYHVTKEFRCSRLGEDRVPDIRNYSDRDKHRPDLVQ
jgi:hypothetical protein